MSLRSVTVWAWVALFSLCPLSTLAHYNEQFRDPYPGESIAHYLGLEILNSTTYAAAVPPPPPPQNETAGSNAQGPAETKNASELDGRDIQSSDQPVPWKPSPIMNRPTIGKPAQLTLSATYNGTDGKGYNITIPGCTPADRVIGDWEAPSGDLIENCSLAQMSQKLRLPPAMLLNFTISRAQSLLDKLDGTLQNVGCDAPLEPPDRELKADPPARFRFNPHTQTGYFSTLLLVMLGSFGVSFTGLHLGIIHEGITADISLTTEVFILSTFATFGTMCVVLIERERRRIAHAEAVVLNFFLAMAEKIWDDMHASVVCAQEKGLAQGVQTLVQKMSEGARVLVTEDVQAAAMKKAGASSVNLIDQAGDIENQLPNGLANGMNGIADAMAKGKGKVCV